MKLTIHHRIPKSYWGNNHFYNKLHISDTKHKALHILHENDLLHDQIKTLIDISGNSIQTVFREELFSVLQDYTPEQIYNEKCCNMNKLVSKILESKQF